MEQHQQHDESPSSLQNITFDSTIIEEIAAFSNAPNLNEAIAEFSNAANLNEATAEFSNVTNLNVDNLLWSDLEVDEHGKATGVCGFLFQQLRSNQLRTICSRLGIKGVKNAKKKEMIDKVVAHHQNHEAYKSLEVAEISNNNVSPRKQVQCPFRLMNVLFSDTFAPRLATLGNAATRHELDNSSAAYDQGFWLDVRRAFTDDTDSYGCLFFSYDNVLGSQDHIDPSIIVPHDWKKLRTIWKSVNADYKAAIARFTVSGTHESDFYSFCNGRLDVYYLRKHLYLRPELNETIEADLPSECAMSSLQGDDDMGSSSTTPSKRKREKSKSNSELYDLIRDIGESKMRTALTTKQKLTYMEKEDKRREEELKLREEELKLKEEEHEQRKHQLDFDEWEKIQSNIRSLRKDLSDPTITDADRNEILHDIASLSRRKNDLANKLGF
jgi:hypothetical protein